MTLHHHPNAQIAQRMWTAIADGDPDTLLQVLDPDIDWCSVGHNRLSRQIRGAERLLEYFAEVGELNPSLVSTLESILVDESGAVICHHVLATRGRKTLDMDFLLRLWIDDGRIVRAVSIPFDQKANDSFWK